MVYRRFGALPHGRWAFIDRSVPKMYPSLARWRSGVGYGRYIDIVPPRFPNTQVGRDLAANKIQTAFRAYRARKAYKQHLAINRFTRSNIRMRRSKARAKQVLWRKKYQPIANSVADIRKRAGLEFQRAVAAINLVKPAEVEMTAPEMEAGTKKAAKVFEKVAQKLGRSPESAKKARREAYEERRKQIAASRELRTRLRHVIEKGKGIFLEGQVSGHQVGQELAAIARADTEKVSNNFGGEDGVAAPPPQ